MAIHISQPQNYTFTAFTTANETYILEPFATITVAGDVGAGIYSGLANITFRVEGKVRAPDTSRAGISNTTNGTTIEIAESGMLDSYNGINDNAVGTKIVNDGYIKASSTGLLLTGETTSIVNNGQIVAAQTAIDIQALDGGPFTIENNGLITGTNIIANFGPEVIMKFGADSVIRGSGYYMIYVGSAAPRSTMPASFALRPVPSPIMALQASTRSAIPAASPAFLCLAMARTFSR